MGIMIVGNGAVATTFMTGVLMTRRGLTKPVGSMTQYDKIRVGKGDDKKYLPVLESWANLPFEAVAEHARWATERLSKAGLDRTNKTD